MPRRITRSRGQAQTIAVVVTVVLVFLMGFFILRSPSPPGTSDILKKALENLQKEDSFRLVILEEGPGYNLFFQGEFETGVLTGELPEYGLEVLFEEELSLRRSSEDEWQTAEAMNLQDLAGFLFSPVDILSMQAGNFSGAFAGTDVTLSNQLYKTIFLELSPDEKIIGELFPEIDLHMIDKIKMGVALTDPDLEIKQLRIILEFTGGAGDLERTYYLE